MANKDLIYTTIGTCRVAEPLGATLQIRNLRRNNANIYGFVHTVAEVLQQIDYLEGREFPAELGRFLSPEGVLLRSPRTRTDVFVVEISSVKEIVLGDWYLQINYLERNFRERRELLDTFFRLKAERDPDVRRERFATIPSFASVDPLEEKILIEGFVRATSRDELDAGMASIVARLGAPVVFVSHINVPNAGGTLIETRARLCAWVGEICRERGYRHFDPTPRVEAFGQGQALAEAGTDLNHYTAEFKPVLGSIIFDEVLSGLVGRMGQAAMGIAPTSPAEADGPPPVSAPLPPAPLHANLQAALSEAKRHIAEGELDDAEVVLHGLTVEDSRTAPVRTMFGTIAFHRGETSVATAEFRTAVEIDPAAVEPRLMLVKSALRVGRLDEACAIAADLVQRAPDDLRIQLVAAKAMMRAKRFGEATAIWRRVAYMRPELVLPLIEMARCELKSRNYEAALTAAEEALTRDARETGALVIKSDALLKLKRMRELAEVSLELAAIEPRAAMAAVPALISALFPEEAAAIIATARGTGEVDIDAVMRAALIRTLERRGKVAVERGDTPAAAAAWKAVLLIEPGSHRSASGLRKLFSPLVAAARAKMAEGDLSGAAGAYEAALALQDDNARILRELALVHEKAGAWLAASERWSQLARVSDDAVGFQRRAARAAMRAERYDIAVRLYQALDNEGDEQGTRALNSAMRRLVRAMREDFAAGHLEIAAYKAYVVLEIDPESEIGQRTFRKVMATYSRRLREAVLSEDAALQEEIGRKMLELEPSRPDALKVLARLYRQTKRYRDGIEVLQRLTEVEPDDTRHWVKLARSCRAVRLYDRGVPAALRALEIEPGDAATVSLLSDMLNRQAAAA